MKSLRTLFVFSILLIVAAAGLSRSTGVGASQPLSGEPEACVQAFWGSGSQTGGKLINLRINLTDIVSEGEVYVALFSSDPAAVPLPAGVTVPVNEFSTTFQVVTNPVITTHPVVLTASTGKNCSDDHSVLIKAPQLKSLSVQSVMRGGGYGKITVCLTGRAASDIAVQVSSSAPATVAGASIVVPAGKGCVSHTAAVALVTENTPVTLTASLGTIVLVKSTVVKNFEPVFIE